MFLLAPCSIFSRPHFSVSVFIRVACTLLCLLSGVGGVSFWPAASLTQRVVAVRRVPVPVFVLCFFCLLGAGLSGPGAVLFVCFSLHLMRALSGRLHVLVALTLLVSCLVSSCRSSDSFAHVF